MDRMDVGGRSVQLQPYASGTPAGAGLELRVVRCQSSLVEGPRVVSRYALRPKFETRENSKSSMYDSRAGRARAGHHRDDAGAGGAARGRPGGASGRHTARAPTASTHAQDRVEYRCGCGRGLERDRT